VPTRWIATGAFPGVWRNYGHSEREFGKGDLGTRSGGEVGISMWDVALESPLEQSSVSTNRNRSSSVYQAESSIILFGEVPYGNVQTIVVWVKGADSLDGHVSGPDIKVTLSNNHLAKNKSILPWIFSLLRVSLCSPVMGCNDFVCSKLLLTWLKFWTTSRYSRHIYVSSELDEHLICSFANFESAKKI